MMCLAQNRCRSIALTEIFRSIPVSFPTDISKESYRAPKFWTRLSKMLYAFSKLSKMLHGFSCIYMHFYVDALSSFPRYIECKLDSSICKQFMTLDNSRSQSLGQINEILFRTMLIHVLNMAWIVVHVDCRPNLATYC